MPSFSIDTQNLTITKVGGTTRPMTPADQLIFHPLLPNKPERIGIDPADRIHLHGLGVRWDDDVVELRIPPAKAKTTAKTRLMKKRYSTRQRRQPSTRG